MTRRAVTAEGERLSAVQTRAAQNATESTAPCRASGPLSDFCTPTLGREKDGDGILRTRRVVQDRTSVQIASPQNDNGFSDHHGQMLLNTACSPGLVEMLQIGRRVVFLEGSERGSKGAWGDGICSEGVDGWAGDGRDAKVSPGRVTMTTGDAMMRSKRLEWKNERDRRKERPISEGAMEERQMREWRRDTPTAR